MKGIKYSTKKPFTVISAADCNFDLSKTGSAGSPTRAGEITRDNLKKRPFYLKEPQMKLWEKF
jgi:hypothetical protein